MRFPSGESVAPKPTDWQITEECERLMREMLNPNFGLLLTEASPDEPIWGPSKLEEVYDLLLKMDLP